MDREDKDSSGLAKFGCVGGTDIGAQVCNRIILAEMIAATERSSGPALSFE